MKTSITALLLLFAFNGFAQVDITSAQKIQINILQLKSILNQTTQYFSDEARPDIFSVGVPIILVDEQGDQLQYQVIETPVMSKEYTKDHPELKSYTGISSDRTTKIKFSITPNGLTGVIIKDGKYYYLEPSKGQTSENEYDLFDQNSIGGNASCGFNEASEVIDGSNLRNIRSTNISNGSQLRNYRIAIACTGEFTAQNGGTKAGANIKINALLTLINAMYENEMSVTFTLAAANDSIIFTDSATDPFSPSGNSSASASQTVFTNDLNTAAFMPYASYDIGHTLHYEDKSLLAGYYSASGQAGPTPCIDGSKSRAWTQYSEGTAGIASAAFITGIIIHEMGHQFSAWHTFNGDGGNCSGGQYSFSSGYEPGSGSTIMSYLGSCSSSYNLTGGDDNYFHAKSLDQMFNSINGSAGGCITPTASVNNIPTASAGADYTIPKSTPFSLNGTGTDADGSDVLTYTWDQFDQPLANGNDRGALGHTDGRGGYNAVNSTSAPLFRTLQSSTGSRTFPNLASVLNDANNPNDLKGEDLPAVSRTLNFRLVVRDNHASGGAFTTDDVALTVDGNSGPFQITSQNGATLWFSGDSKTITWDVNNTNQAPINCSNVNILISTDGGITFTTLLANTANDGSESITVPNTPSTEARLKLEAVGNIFFDINNTNISISNGSCTPESSQIVDITPITENAGSANLNLNLISFGSPIATLSGDITLSDNNGNLVVDNGSGACNSYSNNPQYHVLKFLAGQTGNLIINSTGTLSSRIQNIYSNDYNNSNVCSNWLASSAFFNGSNITTTSSVTVPVIQGTKYALRISGFNNGNTGNYVLTPNLSTYEPVPAEGSPYSYIYIIYNTNSNLISEFSTNPDLSSYSSGQYRVFGLSYAGGTNLTPYIATTFTSFQTLLGNGTVCGSLSSNSKDITINCSVLPSAPSVNSPTINYNLTASLTATGCSGTLSWYTSASGGSSIFTGTTYITPNLTNTTSYFVDCTENGCISASRSEAIVTVNPSPCPNTLTLVSTANDITSGTQILQTSNAVSGGNPGSITATNTLTGGNTTYDAGKKVIMSPGFKVDAGAVFTAQIGGCN